MVINTQMTFIPNTAELSLDLPETLDETVRSVMTPRVTLAGTQSTSIQKETHEIETMRIEGR